jgi:iron complex transport system ATP-binding protein
VPPSAWLAEQESVLSPHSIEVKNLVAGYEQRVLIRGLFFSISEPSFIAVIGHNGCGKTTFFKTLTGNLPYTGQILVNGHDLRSHGNPSASGLLSYLPQKNTVTFSIPVRELVVMGRFRQKKFFENYDMTDYGAVEQTLAQLQISHLAHRDFTELSGGEQQLVWLAQLMLQDVSLCLLDEPTQHLDIYHKKKIFNLLQKWVYQDGKTVVCITHDLGNLSRTRGYLLNLSKPSPTLEPITPGTLAENQAFLEEGPEEFA